MFGPAETRFFSFAWAKHIHLKSTWLWLLPSGRFCLASRTFRSPQEAFAVWRGDDEQVAIVNRIYRRAMIDGWGPVRIAEELNLTGVSSPWNSVWNPDCIYEMLRNPVYLGVGVANRYSAGIYYMRNPSQPKPAGTDAQALASRKNIPQKIRPSVL